MNADELRALAQSHRDEALVRSVHGERKASTWHKRTADALDQAASDRVALERVRALYEVATGRIEHVYSGLCPDGVEGPDVRDTAFCPACKVLVEFDAALRDEQEGGTR